MRYIRFHFIRLLQERLHFLDVQQQIALLFGVLHPVIIAELRHCQQRHVILTAIVVSLQILVHQVGNLRNDSLLVRIGQHLVIPVSQSLFIRRLLLKRMREARNIRENNGEST